MTFTCPLTILVDSKLNYVTVQYQQTRAASSMPAFTCSTLFIQHCYVLCKSAVVKILPMALSLLSFELSWAAQYLFFRTNARTAEVAATIKEYKARSDQRHAESQCTRRTCERSSSDLMMCCTSAPAVLSPSSAASCTRNAA
jgi:hypothetical protein